MEYTLVTLVKNKEDKEP